MARCYAGTVMLEGTTLSEGRGTTRSLELFGAPDLAFTQFMIETLSVVILALVMTRLRLTPRDHRPLREKIPDAAIAIACGLGFALYWLLPPAMNGGCLLNTLSMPRSKRVLIGSML